MKFLRRFLPLLFLPIFVFAAESKNVRNGAVQAQLVSDAKAIEAGKPFTVALRLQHDEHWHSYWIAPGTGYPTSLNWTLPEGFKAGEIQWPTPHVVKDTAGKITGNGYEKEIFLLVEITPPATLTPGSTVKLTAAADWLMCKDVCMPGDATLDINFPVSAAAGDATQTLDTAWARLLNNARNLLPVKNEAWSVTAAHDAAKATITLTPKAGSNYTPENIHFFSADAFTDYAADQKITSANGTITIEIPLDAAADQATKNLKGVVSSSNGWSATSTNKGLNLDVPFASSTVAATSKTGAGAPDKAGADGQPANAAGAAPDAAKSTLLGTLLLAFVGGMILNLMPCVFPVLGIKILGFVNQAGNARSRIVTHGLVFTGGVLISFWALAGVLLALRAGGSQLGWGFQLQSPAFVFGMASFLLIFALNMSGLFEFGLSATSIGGNLQSEDGYLGSFFTGALAVLVATPCSAPFLAPALGAALSLSAFESILVFTAIGVGLSLPYLLLSCFPQAVKKLPKPGAWMETFKQFMAFPLYATVAWLLWVLAGQTKDDDNALLMIAFGFVLIAMATWAYGRFTQTPGKPWRRNFGMVFSIALLLGGFYIGWPKDAKAASTDGSFQVTWEKWSPEAIKSAQAAGKFVYVDFTARWCATCQTNKATVFSSDDVLKEFGKKNVVLLKGDWTNKDAAITKELARWNRSAVPFNLIYAPGKADPVILPELLTPARVLESLAQAATP